MKKVTVFMSTYNGEKYLEEQIDSILNQKNVCITLLVRDDGSSDKTVDILKKYKSKRLLDFVTGDNLGYGKSFLYLFRIVKEDTDYYAFADQDDIWHQYKLYEAVKYLEDVQSKTGKLYFSNLNLVNENKDIIGIKSFDNINITLGSAYVRQRVAGCTMVFDKILFDLANRVRFDDYKYFIAHDVWMYILCLAVSGKVYYDPHAYIDYRRHSGAITSIGNGIVSRIRNEMKPFLRAKYEKSELSKIILKAYTNEIQGDKRKLIEDVSNYRNNIIVRIKLLFNAQLNCNIAICNLINRVSIIFKVF